MNNTKEILFKYLPLRISKAVQAMPSELLNGLTEIRLRKNLPMSLTLQSNNVFIKENGTPCQINFALCATEQELAECISRLTDGSLYTCDEYLSEGFIPIAEGGRAGICGKANYRNRKIIGFSEITSVNLRLHSFFPLAALPLAKRFELRPLGSLICSPPGVGKTTFLQSLAYLLSVGRVTPAYRVAVADERLELLAGIKGFGIIDGLLGVPKAQAITMLTRTMAPQIIICDEISPAEADSVLQAQSTGVCFVASAHCGHPADLLKRGNMGALLSSGVFPLCVMLDNKKGYTCQIINTEELL